MTPINRKKLLQTHAALIKHGVRYGLGSKAPSLSASPSSFRRIDCSGLVRYLWSVAGGGTIPDGSWNQRAWCEENLKQVPYSQCDREDNVLRIAFMTAGVKGVGKVGHVWFILNGRTVESYGGKGPGSHRWSVYAPRVHKCFEVPSVSGVEESQPDEAKAPMLLIHNGDKVSKKPIEGAYLVNGHWYAPDGSIAHVLGYATQTPSLPVPVLQAAFGHGFVLDEYTQRLKERNRADMRFIRG